MKLMIVGSRSIQNFDLTPHIPQNVDLIITGGAQGIDSLAEEYADRHKISKLILRPRYDLYGKPAPIFRNKQMVELADQILVIWDGHSRGTQSTIEFARKKQKPITIVQKPIS